MSQETISAGRPAEAAMSLRRKGVKPLRGGGVRAPETRQSVEELKNGGLIKMGGLMEESGGRPLKDSGRASKVSTRQGRAAGLPLPERLQKLAQIKKSASEYESFFLDHLVKLMRPSPLAHTPGGETMKGLAEQQFREFLSQAGGLGLANAIAGQIARQEGLEQTLHEHPEVMGPSWRVVIPKNLGPKTIPGLSLAPAGLAAQGSAEAASAPPVQPGPSAGANVAEIAGPEPAAADLIR